jgi:Ni/Co efflux regulator RcnB
MKRWIVLVALLAAPLVAAAQMKGMDMKDEKKDQGTREWASSRMWTAPAAS